MDYLREAYQPTGDSIVKIWVVNTNTIGDTLQRGLGLPEIEKRSCGTKLSKTVEDDNESLQVKGRLEEMRGLCAREEKTREEKKMAA